MIAKILKVLMYLVLSILVLFFSVAGLQWTMSIISSDVHYLEFTGAAILSIMIVVGVIAYLSHLITLIQKHTK